MNLHFLTKLSVLIYYQESQVALDHAITTTHQIKCALQRLLIELKMLCNILSERAFEQQ